MHSQCMLTFWSAANDIPGLQILCRKEINYVKMSIKEREQLHAEFSILHSLRHPNIVAYYHREHLKSTQDIYLYMEYCGGGDLSKVIQKLKTNNQYAEEPFVWSIFCQLITALYRCHYGVDPPEVGKNIMGHGNAAKPQGLRPKTQVMILHRDLKPENGKMNWNWNCVCASTDKHSFSRCGQLGETGGLRPIEIDAIP